MKTGWVNLVLMIMCDCCVLSRRVEECWQEYRCLPHILIVALVVQHLDWFVLHL